MNTSTLNLCCASKGDDFTSAALLQTVQGVEAKSAQFDFCL